MDVSEIWMGKSILVVDDSKLQISEITRIFESLGLNVIAQANNGSEAIVAYEKYKPDLISLDIIMPEMHGVECYRELIRIDPHVKLFFVSCLAMDYVTGAFPEEISSKMYINKPIDIDTLRHCLIELLNLGQSEIDEKSQNNDEAIVSTAV